MTNRWFILGLAVIQFACAIFVLSDIFGSLLGLRSQPISWRMREILELGAVLGLLLGMALSWVALRQGLGRMRRAQEQLRVASGAFMELLEQRFEEWNLTPAERDVALFAIKGLSTSEIAALRERSEGTVKAQTNAIFRKAGVTGRTQLLSLFIEDLMAEPPLDANGVRQTPPAPFRAAN